MKSNNLKGIKKTKLKIIFFSSDDISIDSFKELANEFQIVLLITSEDKPRSKRGLTISETKIAKIAKTNNIPVIKPNKLLEVKNFLKKIDFDIFLVFSYGKYIPTEILKLSKFPPLNIHASILPKYRGPAPIHHALLNNDKKIGISLMVMIDKIDAGPVFFQAKSNISNTTTLGEAREIISNLAKIHVNKWLRILVKNQFKNSKKQPNNFSLAPKLNNSFCELSSDLEYESLKQKIRICNPKPGAFIFIKGKRLKIFKIAKFKTPLSLIFDNKKIYFSEYQYEGKKRIAIKK